MLIADFKSTLAESLGDSDMIYWTSSELDLIIRETLLTSGAISGYWKSRILVESKEDQQFYNLLDAADIKSGATNLATSLIYQTIIDWIDKDLIGYLQVADLAEVVELITDAINEFQLETKLVLAVDSFVVKVGQPVDVSGDVLDIVAAYYIDSSGVYYALQLADENAIALLNSNYIVDQSKPRFYSLANVEINKIDLFPRPSEGGFLELVYVIGKVGEQDENSSCLIPNNLVPYLKYKVLRDIFNKDSVKDSSRAAYCNQRWNEGIIIGKNYATITNTKLNGLNKIPASILDFDKLRYGWRNIAIDANKKVNSIALAGYNIVAFDKIPTAGTYSALFECISNAPIDEVEIDIRSDFIPLLLDYCIHIAFLKDGIVRLQSTQNNLEKFIKNSAYHNEFLQIRRISYLELLGKSKYPLKQARLHKEDAA